MSAQQQSAQCPLWIPTVYEGKHVIRGEWVLCDGELAEVIAWNDIPTFYMRVKNQKQLKEVEPWRIHKIEKVSQV